MEQAQPFLISVKTVSSLSYCRKCANAHCRF